jgi:hypothetical protein
VQGGGHAPRRNLEEEAPGARLGRARHPWPGNPVGCVLVTATRCQARAAAPLAARMANARTIRSSNSRVGAASHRTWRQRERWPCLRQPPRARGTWTPRWPAAIARRPHRRRCRQPVAEAAAPPRQAAALVAGMPPLSAPCRSCPRGRPPRQRPLPPSVPRAPTKRTWSATACRHRAPPRLLLRRPTRGASRRGPTLAGTPPSRTHHCILAAPTTR